jgi:hypothetical protein
MRLGYALSSEGHAPVSGRTRRASCASSARSSSRPSSGSAHIKDSYQERGVSAREAKERAARTVNKQRGKSKKKDS